MRANRDIFEETRYFSSNNPDKVKFKPLIALEVGGHLCEVFPICESYNTSVSVKWVWVSEP
jgi:hypothetical protein